MSLIDLYYNSSYNPKDSLVYFTSSISYNDSMAFSEIDEILKEFVRLGIIYGVRCGAAMMTSIIMWLISSSRKTPIFIVNQISLILVVIHSSFNMKYALSNYSSMTFQMTGFPQVLTKNNTHVYGAASIFQVMLVASIEISLVFQVRVILLTEKVGYIGNPIFIFCCIFGITTTVMYLATTIKAMIAFYSGTLYVKAVYFNVSTILLASSINIMTIILIVKLVFAVRSRRYLGLKQFDAFHILLIISCHSLMVPSILYIVAYSTNGSISTDTIISVANLLVVLSLPLSSMWATTASNSSNTTFTYHDGMSNKYFTENSSVKTIGDDFTLTASTFKSKLYSFSPRRTRNVGEDLENTAFNLEVDEIKQSNNHEIYEIDTSSGKSESPLTIRNNNYLSDNVEDARILWKKPQQSDNEVINSDY
ncbi:Pheromone alpha factor receptor [Nakaseomyces bracarensis]|uniref:Pheromone alpha factor receptor n=1 Tax=Nakaseomyces bracarensis TaxID=273131 RepID=A0ABR4NP79_9SACH